MRNERKGERMKQYQINAAYNTMRRIAAFQLPVRVSYEIYRLIKRIEPVHEFAAQRERKLLEKYHGTVRPDGSVIFPTQDETVAFRNEIQELNDMEVSEEIAPITISYDAMGDNTLSPTEIACLDGFIAFE